MAKAYTASKTIEHSGALPITINANDTALIDYRIYGASGGVGDDSGTAYGYVIPISVSDGTASTTTPIYIGSDPLGEDEYVDYGKQKVYRRTENLLNPDDIVSGYYANKNFSITQSTSDTYKSIKTYLEQGTYTISFSANVLILRRIIDGVYTTASATVPFTFTVSSDGFVGFSWRNSDNSDWDSSTKIMLIEGSTAPSTYIPYLQPTDPPVPLPALPTCDGTTIVDYGGTPKPEQMYIKYSWSGWESCAVKRYHISKNKFNESQAEIISTANGDFYGVNMGILTGDYTFGAAMATRSTLYVQHGYITDAFTYPSDSMFIEHYMFGDGEPVKIYTNSATQTTFADEGITRIMMNEGQSETRYEPYGSWWEPCTEYVRRNGVWVPQT